MIRRRSGTRRVAVERSFHSEAQQIEGGVGAPVRSRDVPGDCGPVGSQFAMGVKAAGFHEIRGGGVEIS